MKNTLMNFAEYCEDEHGLPIPSWMIDNYLKSINSAQGETPNVAENEAKEKTCQLVDMRQCPMYSTTGICNDCRWWY